MDLHLLRGNKDWLFDFNSYIRTHTQSFPLIHTRTHTQIHPNTLTGLLLLGPARGFVGLTPDSDAVFQQLQSSTLLPARRADLYMREMTPLYLIHCMTAICSC